MTDKTRDIDVDDLIIEFENITEDDLYDLRVEAENIGAVALAARVEIERKALFASGQNPEFGQHELLEIGMMLLSASGYREQSGEDHRVKRIEELAQTIFEGLDIDYEGLDVDAEEVQEQIVERIMEGDV